MEYSLMSFRTFVFLSSLLALICVDSTTEAYSTGAPTAVCTSLTPGHGSTPQTTASPFSILPKYQSYGPSTSLEVNLTASPGNTFKGFMVQARKVGTVAPLGIFSDPSSLGQSIGCTGGFANTLTHNSNTAKTSVVVTWTAPSEVDGSLIEFVGAFVQSKPVYWTNVKSVVLSDPCNPLPCQNGGTCYRGSAGQGHFCTCAEGFIGDNCTDTPPCQDEILTCGLYSTECLLSGQSPTSFVCKCTDGQYSFDAPCPDPETTTMLPTTTIDPCTTSPCYNGGFCHLNSVGVVQCFCVDGYTGTNCEIPPGPCGTLPCQNGGSCENSADLTTYTCTCTDMYTGSECQFQDYCNAVPCQNSGVCTNLGDGSGYTCQCIGLYTGPQCQFVVGCASIPCENGGRCTSTGIYGQDYVCDCGDSYTGTNCETPTDPCATQPCMNGGMCSRRGDTMGYVCSCFNGYTGVHCETAPPPTTPPPPTTQPPSTTTTSSTIDPTVCDQNCQNGGSCIQGSCACTPGYGGPLCEQDLRPVFSNCPQGETLSFILEEDSSRAMVDLDPITATNYLGAALTVMFMDGPNVNAVSFLEFSTEYAEGQAVVARAVDEQGRVRDCTFTLRLIDDQLPSIVCPAAITEITTASSIRVEWPAAIATDNADPSPAVTYSMDSGSVFQGTGQSTSVIARATDSSGNYKECVFEVTVHQRDYDCEDFPTVSNGRVDCLASESGRECQVTCDSGYVNIVGGAASYTCIADSQGTFWDPTPSDICASAEVGTGVTKTVTISFSLTCPENDSTFNAAVISNITDTLEAKALCEVGTASACGPNSITADCFTSNSAARRRRNVRTSLSRQTRDSNLLLVAIDVNTPVSDEADQSRAEAEVDQLVEGIEAVADDEGFELQVDGEVTSNSQSETQSSTEFQWSCDQGQVSSSSGCGSCPPGTAYDVSRNVCTFCARGTYQERAQQTSCQMCPTGSTTDAAGSTSRNDCYDNTATSLNLTETQWILVYIAGAVAAALIIVLLITLLICCCKETQDSSGPQKGKKDVTDHLTYLNRAFDDETLPAEMQYSGTLSRTGTPATNGHAGNGHIPNGDARLIEIPDDPAYLYAEVPVTSFNARGYDDFDTQPNGHANGRVSTVSGGVDMGTMPRPPSMAAHAPPPPLPPADTKPSRQVQRVESFPPPPLGNNHQFGMPEDSAPVGFAPPPPAAPAPAPPPPPSVPSPPPPPPSVPSPPPPKVPNTNNSHSSSPTSSTASGRSGRRTKFNM